MIRKIENVHILLWLLKDISWCLVYKPLAIAMIFPTLAIGILVTYVHRKNITDLIHNSSVVFWITANSFWMITEFLGAEHNFLNTGIPGKWIAAGFFAIGIALLIFYYTYRAIRWWLSKKSTYVLEEIEEAEMSNV
jgi:hypothetical protein